MPVTMPFTISGATFATSGLEYTDDTECAIQNKLLSVYSNDFSSDLGELSETDSGTNVEVTSGHLSITGTGSWNANGVYLTSLKSFSTPGKIKLKVTRRGAAGYIKIGFADSAALSSTDETGMIYITTTYLNIESISIATSILEDAQWDIEFEWDADKNMISRVNGGDFSSLTRVSEIISKTLGANIGFQINQHSGTAWEYDDYERYSGFGTSEIVTYSQIDSGVSNTTWAISSLGLHGDTTGIQFSYAVGNASMPTNWSSFESLPLAPSGSSHQGRYFRVRAKLVSDGSTRRILTGGTIQGTLGRGGQTIFTSPFMTG